MKYILFLFALVSSLCCQVFLGCASAPPQTQGPSNSIELQLAYDIEPTIYEGRESLKIALQFLGNFSGRTFIRLPHSEHKGLNYLENIKEFKVTSENATFNNTYREGIVYIQHRPGEPVGISYILVGTNRPTTKLSDALIQKDYFLISAKSGLAVPLWNSDEALNTRMRWKNFPKDFIFPNSFSVEGDYQIFKATYEELFDGMFLGGKLKLKRYEADGKPLYIASLGNWKFTEEELFQNVSRIISFQRQFWSDDGFSSMLVSLLPFRGDDQKSSGEAFHQAFALYVGEQRKIDVGVRSLISHEMFHTWNAKVIAPPQDEDYLHTTWFTEGFTSYYANRLLLKSGMMTFREYVDDLNSTLRFYYTSPYRNTPNEENAESIYVDRAAQHLPYLRGELLAHNWDYLLRTAGEKGASLDLVMKDLFKISKAKGRVLTNSLIDDTFEKYLKTGIKPQIKDYVSKGKTIEPEAFPLGPCVARFSMKYKKRKSTDADKTAKTVHEINLNKKANLVEVPITKKTDLKELVDVPQLKLDEGIFKSDPKGCLAFLIDSQELKNAANY